jgi:hypothetical protein
MSDGAERKPETFDWVTARAKCSSVEIFAKLRMAAEQDVQRRLALRKHDETWFRFVAGNELRFAVVAEEPITNISKTITFSMFDGQIKAADAEGKIIVTGRPTLGDDGECRVRIAADKTVDLWQLRKMALEDLFFNDAIWNS